MLLPLRSYTQQPVSSVRAGLSPSFLIIILRAPSTASAHGSFISDRFWVSGFVNCLLFVKHDDAGHWGPDGCQEVFASQGLQFPREDKETTGILGDK